MYRLAVSLALCGVVAFVAPPSARAGFVYTTSVIGPDGTPQSNYNYANFAYTVSGITSAVSLQNNGGMISVGKHQVSPTGSSASVFTGPGQADGPLTLAITITDTGTGKSGRIKLKDNIAGNFANEFSDTNFEHPDPYSVNLSSEYTFSDPDASLELTNTLVLEGVTFSVASGGFFDGFTGIYNPNDPNYSEESVKSLMLNLTISPSVGAVPEPSSAVLAVLGGLGVLASSLIRGRRRPMLA